MYTLELGYVNCGFIFFAVALAGTAVFGPVLLRLGLPHRGTPGFLRLDHEEARRPAETVPVALSRVRPLAAAAFYMFALPTLLRLTAGGDARAFPGFSNHLVTDLAVGDVSRPFVRGASRLRPADSRRSTSSELKGFCTYVLPLRAMFGALDYAAPGRIVVNDNCEQCGHCTATCTSNVRVHEEVRLYGMVVDPGCMKCMDCVSVCPKHALRFSFAVPPILKERPRGAPRRKRYDLSSLRTELLLVAVGLVAMLRVPRVSTTAPPLSWRSGWAASRRFSH